MERESLRAIPAREQPTTSTPSSRALPRCLNYQTFQRLENESPCVPKMNCVPELEQDAKSRMLSTSSSARGRRLSGLLFRRETNTLEPNGTPPQCDWCSRHICHAQTTRGETSLMCVHRSLDKDCRLVMETIEILSKSDAHCGLNLSIFGAPFGDESATSLRWSEMTLGNNHVTGIANDAHAGRPASVRRSQRVCLNIEVELFVYRGAEIVSCEQTKTLTVSAHGALVLLNTRVRIGDLLSMRNVKTKNESACRVVDVTIGNTGIPEVGVEFLQPETSFWHIAFPPADWSARGPESKTFGSQILAKISKATKE